ncbi:N2227-like protein [Cordyceps fumosorosea ARSEF 2679]|uniref:N2227-like protein n=1 Tax=Cordyceps fumosorosea (strain ARSEF 2679) TaxID=1081104 RepID=A0A167LQH5_CORFA|nr:N2227-like protein [Cordyceps fumosorosea ARSEF 2679]OAA53374.1 N2227-like protein [Cordyceps fumosorosea ARSEF 2679]
MVQRDNLLPVAFGGVLISLVMMFAMPFNLLVVGALATFLLGIFGSYYGAGDAMGRIKSAVASTEIFAEQIPSQTTHDSEDAIDLLESFRRAQEPVKGSRHEAMKVRLLQSLQRDRNWSSAHPRHRLLDALYGFQSYYERQQVELERFRGLYKHLGRKHKTLLDLHIQYSTKFDRVDEHLALNQRLCDTIVQSALAYYQVPPQELKKHAAEMLAAGKRADRTSVSQALKHYVRDWSPSGANECEETFPALLGTLETLFPERAELAAPLRVLLPGSGLNRLAHEVARLGGFQVTANEWSAFMNVAYRFLETFPDANASVCHPFADTWSHHITEGDMLRPVRFPEVSLDRGGDSVLLVEGDFTTVFNHELGSYDVLLTYFFIDTARNLMSYFDTIEKLLRPGGYWINLGPLLYGTGPLVQLSLEEIISITETMGFDYVETDEKYGSLTIPGRTVRGMRAVYSFDDKALTTSAYKAQFWVARKQ